MILLHERLFTLLDTKGKTTQSREGQQARCLTWIYHQKTILDILKVLTTRGW